MKRLTVVAALIAAFIVAVAAIAGAATSSQSAPGEVTIQFLAVSDWHGQLDPINGIGGAAAIESYWDQDRALNPNTIELTAGDDFGASPPISNFFGEVPAVQAERMMGIDFNTFGNHNFDRGVEHLQQMIDIAGAPAGVQPGDPYRYVVANMKNLNGNLDGVDPFAWAHVAGLKIAVIGAINEEAPTLVKPGSFGTTVITDAAEAINKRVEVARKAKADIVIVLTHKGVRGFENGQPFGELIDLANAVEGVDVIFGDHTDIQYSGMHNDVLVVEARSKGVSYSRTQVTVKDGTVVSKGAQFITPTAALVTPDADIAALIAGYRTQIAPIMQVQIGTSAVAIPRADSCGRSDGRLCESRVGNTVTDAMRLTYGTDFAITNSGGLRDSLTCPTVDNPSDFCPAFTPPPYPITRGQVNAVLPFGNVVNTVTVNGAELKAFLENGVSAMPGANGRFPQVSGLCFTYDVAATPGSRVLTVNRQTATGECAGAAVDLTAGSSYTLAINDFMASGGDGYPVVASRATSRDIMDQAVADWIGANSPVSGALQGRITCTDSVEPNNCPVFVG